jgi:hypothetical protein
LKIKKMTGTVHNLAVQSENYLTLDGAAEVQARSHTNI